MGNYFTHPYQLAELSELQGIDDKKKSNPVMQLAV